MMTPSQMSAYAMGIIEDNPSMAIPWYLMTAYVYYVADGSLVTDDCYDEIYRVIRDNYPWLRHQHKHLIDHQHMLESETSSAYYLQFGQFPERIISSAAYLMAIQIGDKERPTHLDKK